MKRLFAICGALFLCAYANAYDFVVDGIYYNILSEEDKTCEVTYKNDYYDSYSGDVVIPSSANGYKVASIGIHAFDDCSELTNVTIPNSITSIGSNAFFGCTGLTSVTIPNSVTSIGSNAFSCCTVLTSVIINMQDEADFASYLQRSDISIFHSSELTDKKHIISINGIQQSEIKIPSSVTSIGKSALSHCTGLTSVTIPNSVTSIGSSAFYSCTGLTSVTIPNSVTTLASSAFQDCSKLTCVTISMQDESDFASYLSRSDISIFYTSELIDKKHIISINGIQQSEIEIPSSVTSIGKSAFSHCAGLTSVTIPNSVTSIGSSAFSDCTGLTNVTIPNSINTISSSTFGDCTGLTSVTIPNNVTSISSNAFYHCTGLTSITIPNSVTSIGSFAFYKCTGLMSVTIPNSVTSIGSSAFSGCTGLTNIGIQNGSISYKEFSGCTGLTSVSIPSSVTSIDSYAFSDCTGLNNIDIKNNNISSSEFSGCTGLTSVSIPSSVTTIGDKAFAGCSSLMSVTNYATTPQTITTTTFPDQGTLHVLSGYGDIYASTTGWKNFLVKEDATLPVEEEDADTYTITDGTDYTSTALTHVTTLKYSRTFSNTKWQALYIPFSLSYSDIRADLDIAWLNNVHMYDDNGDNEPDRTTLEFYIMNSGTTEPNTPYLVRAHSSGTFSITLSDVDVSPAVCDPFECSTFTQTFTVYGTYTGVTGADMVSNKYYAPANGSLCYTTNTSASLKPQRWYLKVANKDGSAVTNLAPSIRVMIDGEMLDEEETAISNLSASPLSGSYVSIDGRSVANPTAPGLYVHNNKKVFIR